MDHAMTNFELIKYANVLKIPHFRGVFMRDQLPRKSDKVECWILNQAKNEHPTGTHWCALVKIENDAYYFDSFGKLPPPLEVITYLGRDVNFKYNYNRYQNYDEIICGQLCLIFLYDFWQTGQRKV